MLKSARFVFVLSALCIIGLSSMAHADSRETAKRMSLYEVKNFLRSFDHAINHQDIHKGHVFYERNVRNDAGFNTVIMKPYYTEVHTYQAHGHYSGHGYRHAYRYPQAFMMQKHPIRAFNEDKAGIIGLFHAKKTQIPGYRQETLLEGFSMEALGRRAEVNVTINEYASEYGYGVSSGYIQSKLRHTSDCRMFITNTSGKLSITGMSCEMISH